MNHPLHFILILLLLCISSSSSIGSLSSEFNAADGVDNAVTIRVNTFRRLDLLEIFLDHYDKCKNVKEIQVVWSDQKSKAPTEWLQKYTKDKVIFEVHASNSLNNRFLNLTPSPTEAVLSIDDDLVTPCDTLDQALTVWRSNKHALVGFSPRLTVFDIVTGSRRYMRWQHTWWSGSYNIVLTKACLLHRDYLKAYFEEVPKAFLSYIDEMRNCEDIAMAHTVAKKSGAAPVWFSGVIYETGSAGISSQSKHFLDRGECVSRLESLTGFSGWVSGYQKMVPLGLGLGDVMRWWNDSK